MVSWSNYATDISENDDEDELAHPRDRRAHPDEENELAHARELDERDRLSAENPEDQLAREEEKFVEGNDGEDENGVDEEEDEDEYEEETIEDEDENEVVT